MDDNTYQSALTTADDIIVREQVQEKRTIDNINSMANDLKTPKEQFIDEHRTVIQDDDISMFPRPRSGCKHCYGRGYEAFDVERQEALLCRCVRNRLFKEFRQDKLLTYGELREIYNAPRRLRGLPDITIEEEVKDEGNSDNK